MKNRLLRGFGFVIGIVGIGIITYVFYPILAYEIVNNNFDTYLSPVPAEELATQTRDFTKPSNWFVGAPEVVESQVRFYTLSIPKLKIEKATVSVGGEDLSQYLIQYPGTSLPGKRGNAVIFGHSILPQFYNPKDYMTIFSTLPTLKKGDIVNIYFDGIGYDYKIEDMFEVKPTDIQIFEQNTSDSFITLVTCVPPGHPLRPRRLIVRGRLIPLEERSQLSEYSRN